MVVAPRVRCVFNVVVRDGLPVRREPLLGRQRPAGASPEVVDLAPQMGGKHDVLPRELALMDRKDPPSRQTMHETTMTDGGA